MPKEALQAHAGTFNLNLNSDEIDRTSALKSIWNPSQPMEVFDVGTISCGPSILPIARHIYPSIQRLALCRAPLMNRADCAKGRPFAHQRMLAAFGHCTGTANFVFDLSGAKDDTVRVIKAMEWMRLYSSAIRCSSCTTGFVFIDWRLSPDGLPQTMLLWFDVGSGRQLLIDPSGTANVFHKMFANNQHIWDPVGTTKTFDVTDINTFKKCLAQKPLDSHCDDATFLVLIVWACLRFGYTDVTAVTSAIMCALCEHMKQNRDHFRKFWDFVCVWRNELRLEALTHSDLLYLLGLKVVNNNQPCGYKMNGGAVCTTPGDDDNVLCKMHRPKVIQTKTQTIQNLLKVRMFPLPDNVARVACPQEGHTHYLQATAYFEDRWQSAKGADGTLWWCSWDTFRIQIDKKQINANHEWSNRIGCVRFVSADGGENTNEWLNGILAKFVEPKRLQSSIDAFGVLNVDFLTGNHNQHPEFLSIVLKQVPVHPWSAMVVAIQSVPVFVSMRLATYSSLPGLQETINGFLTTSPVSFHLQIGTDVRTIQGLVCKRPLFTVCNGF